MGPLFGEVNRHAAVFYMYKTGPPYIEVWFRHCNDW